MKINDFLMTILLLFFASSLIAKPNYPLEENEMWLSAEFSYCITDELELDVEQELRYYKNRSVLKQSLSDIGLAYKLTSLMKLSLSYRLRLFPDSEESHRHELYSQIGLKSDIKWLELRHRLRLHLKFRDDNENINQLRYRLALRYPVSKLVKPYISGELFYRFLYDKGDRLTQGRYFAGLIFSLNKNHVIDLFFARELEYNTKKAVNSNILGLAYTFSY